MLGLMIIGGLVLYIMIAIKVTSYVMNKTDKTEYAVMTALIFFLIPTWDLILGYPIYWYLCKHEAGIKIYKSVDNVEGFYVGKQDGTLPVEPYQDYRFIDYHDKEDGKYYRNSWLDSNTSDLCVPVGIYRYSNYAEAFAKGKCIAKEEIQESEVSRWEVAYITDKKINIIPILALHKRIEIEIINRNNGKVIAEAIDCNFGQGWIIGLLSSNVIGNRSWESCMGYDYSYHDILIKKTLIPVGGK